MILIENCDINEIDRGISGNKIYIQYSKIEMFFKVFDKWITEKSILVV